MTPLETKMLAALRLRRATSYPHTPPPVGLGLPYDDDHTCSAAQARRAREADAAVDAAIAAGEREEAASDWQLHDGGPCPTQYDRRVDVRFAAGLEWGGRDAAEWDWRMKGDGAITHWRHAV